MRRNDSSPSHDSEGRAALAETLRRDPLPRREVDRGKIGA